MEAIHFTHGQRVDVDFIRTEEWHSEKFIRNGIYLRTTEAGQLVVTIDDQSEHSYNLTGGYLYPFSYDIKPTQSIN